MNATPNDKPPANPNERLIQLKTLYYQGKTCYAISIIFAVCGFLVFASMYANRIAPDPMAALRDVTTILLIVAAFMPAIVLSFLARKYERRYLDMLNKE